MPDRAQLAAPYPTHDDTATKGVDVIQGNQACVALLALLLLAGAVVAVPPAGSARSASSSPALPLSPGQRQLLDSTGHGLCTAVAPRWTFLDATPRSYGRWVGLRQGGDEVLSVGGRSCLLMIDGLRLLADTEGAEDGCEDLVGGDVLAQKPLHRFTGFAEKIGEDVCRSRRD